MMKRLRLALVGWTALVLWGCGVQEARVETEQEKLLYAFGLGIAEQLHLKNLLSAEELKVCYLGMADVVADKERTVQLKEYLPQMQQLLRERSADSTGAARKPAEEKVLYTIGLGIAEQYQLRNLVDAEELKVVHRGLSDAIVGKEPLVDFQAQMPRLNLFLQERQNALLKKVKERGRAYLEKEAAAAGALKTESGLVYQELQAGEGPRPGIADRVKVHYHGTLIDGTVFDSSVQRGEPISFGLNQVIKGWQEGLQMMKVGGKARLIVPPELAYGDKAMGKIPPGSTLVFEVELLGIE